jgi:superfamily II DNA or RNA helicase
MVVSPAGSGKTLIAAGALDRVIARRDRTRRVRLGWIANTREQVEQAHLALRAFPRLESAVDAVVCCPAGAPAHWELDVLVVDECHHGVAETWFDIITRHRGAAWFLTATPWGPDEERNAALRRLVGSAIYTVPRSAVKDRVVEAHVHLLDDTDPDLRPVIDAAIERESAKMRRLRVSEDNIRRNVVSRVATDLGVIANRARNAAVVRVAKHHAAESTLVLVSKIEHGEELAAQIPGSALCYSKMGVKKRCDTIAAFRAGELRCLLATSLADEGFDAPVATVLVLVGAGRSATRAEQRTGRVLRVHEGKRHGTIIDFMDVQHAVLASQARGRQAVFRELGYRFCSEGSSTAYVARSL